MKKLSQKHEREIASYVKMNPQSLGSHKKSMAKKMPKKINE